jgi:hypothetical protein
MSTYQARHQTGEFIGGPVQSASRPGVLTSAVAASVLAALLVIVSQIMSIATGESLIQDALREQAGSAAADLANSVFQAEIADAYSTLQSRAILGIVFASLVLLFAALALRGGLGARITLAVVLVLMAGVTIISVGDIFPAFGKAAGTVAILLAPVAIVLLFLPAANRYSRARKAARTA